MTAKQREMLDALYPLIEPEYHGLVAEMAAHLDGLGYHPRRKKAVGYVLEFYHPRLRKGIAKLRAERGGLRVNLRFSAAEGYSPPFAAAVLRSIEHTSGYTQIDCGACGVCGPMPRTYRYRYPDGREVRFCGSVALPLGAEALGHTGEILRLITAQHAHFSACAQMTETA